MDNAVLFAGKEIGVTIWFEDQEIILSGFKTFYDCWAFVFFHTGIDLSRHAANNHFTKKAEVLEPKQLKMFTLEKDEKG